MLCAARTARLAAVHLDEAPPHAAAILMLCAARTARRAQAVAPGMSSAHAAEAILMLCAARTARLAAVHLDELRACGGGHSHAAAQRAQRRLAAVHLDELRACGGGHSHAVRSAHSAPSSGAPG
eukprot:jgi/Ulvmu1/8534/UM044_0068.1